MGKWQSKYKTGERNNSWLGGWEKYYGINWIEQKNKARERDDFICQKCGKKENGKAFDVHHKIKFRLFGKKNYLKANNLKNLITLCNPCHSSVEPKKRES
jgi:5-methylcytosine-specific restriction endonuclease McrA